MTSPLFSVVLPTFERASILRRVLAAWEQQRPEELPFEVVVADDGSADATPELLAGRRPRRYRLRALRQPNRGPAAARNLALAHAEAPLVLISGDDIEPAPSLLAEHLEGHRRHPAPGTAIVGHTGWPPGAETTATMRHVNGPGAQQFSYHYFEDGREYDFRHLYTSNISLRRDLLELEPGPFSTDFPAAAFEDAELGYRLERHGLRIFYRAAARAHHHHHYTARGFFSRQLRCGEMAAVLYRKLPELEKWLDVSELERTRIAALAAGEARRRAVQRVAGQLARWQQRALALAELFDPIAEAPVDSLLRALFRYAYLRGLARALHPPPVARSLAAALYCTLLPPAVAELRARTSALGIPCPRADTAAIAALARELLSQKL